MLAVRTGLEPVSPNGEMTAIHSKPFFPRKNIDLVLHVIQFNKKSLSLRKAFNVGGPDGTRTRDPMRDRHVF